MRRVVSIDQIRDFERAVAGLGLPEPALMENAGRGVADVICQHSAADRAQRILVLVGPGNNGGDGLVVARHLHDRGRAITVYVVGRPPPEDAKLLLLRQRRIGVHLASDDGDFRVIDALIAGSDLVVDALFGAGRLRAIADPFATIIDRVNGRLRSTLAVSVDVPSGVNADSGSVDDHTIRADVTVTLGLPKRGLFLGRAAQVAGDIFDVDIGIPSDLSRAIRTCLADRKSIAALLPERPRVSHKGSYGKALIVAGSLAYTGAPVLAALGAARVGAGLVTLACPARVRESLAFHLVEATFLPLPDDQKGELGPSAIGTVARELVGYTALLVGPGIGRAATTGEFLLGLLGVAKEAQIPTIVDADGLTLLSSHSEWWKLLPDNTILTPHPGEMSRLTDQAAVEDRIEAATRWAAFWSCVVVLKGAYSIVARPDGQCCVVPFANPALATAGTGDVLAGTILGLLAQRLTPSRAALVAAYLHGVAGDLLSDTVGSAGGLAGELATRLPTALRGVRESTESSPSGLDLEW